MKFITRTVWKLSLVSLFTDTASEMLYPVIPLYLKSIGFSIVLIGILDGFAEVTAGLSQGYFGKLSDQAGKRMPFVQWGYALSALSKPMMALLILPIWVFFVRTLDRIGKGLRTGGKRCYFIRGSNKENKGRIFGFYRSLDTIGAVFGPLVALLYLHWHPGNYKQLFFIALVPGTLAIACTFLLKDKAIPHKKVKAKVGFFHISNIGRNALRNKED